MSALQSSSQPTSQPASQPASQPSPSTSTPSWFNIGEKADLLVRGSTSIHYLMGERLRAVGPATEVSDTLHWPGQRRAAWPNTNMLSSSTSLCLRCPQSPLPLTLLLPLQSPPFHPSLAFTIQHCVSFSWSMQCWGRPVAMAGPGNGRGTEREEGGGGGGGHSSFYWHAANSSGGTKATQHLLRERACRQGGWLVIRHGDPGLCST